MELRLLSFGNVLSGRMRRREETNRREDRNNRDGKPCVHQNIAVHVVKEGHLRRHPSIRRDRQQACVLFFFSLPDICSRLEDIL